MDSEDRKHILLGFTYENQQTPVTGLTWLQKLVFFLQHETDLEPYTFVPDEYGPFSDQLVTDVNELVKHNYIARTPVADANNPQPFEITEKGIEYYEFLIDEKMIDSELRATIQSVKSYNNDRPALELLKEVKEIKSWQMSNCSVL